MAAADEDRQTAQIDRQSALQHSAGFFSYREAYLVDHEGHVQKWFICNICEDVKCSTKSQLEVSELRILMLPFH